MTAAIAHERPAQARKMGSPTTPGWNVVRLLPDPPGSLDATTSSTLTSSSMRCSVTMVIAERPRTVRCRRLVAVSSSQWRVYSVTVPRASVRS